MLTTVSTGTLKQHISYVLCAVALGILTCSLMASPALSVSGQGVNAAAQPDGSDVWYLAEGSTAWGFSTWIAIANPNNSDVTAAVTYQTDTGPVSGGLFNLPATSQTIINPKEKVGERDFSTEVRCVEGEAIAVDRSMHWEPIPGHAYAMESHCSIGVNTPDTSWYLPEGSSNWGFECWLLIQNPNDQEATCTVTYMIENEDPQSRRKVIPKNSRKSYNMADDIGNKDASIKVESDVPVIPERAMYRNNKRCGHDSIGTNRVWRESFLAEGTTNYGFSTYVLIQNPNDVANSVTVTYLTNNGPVTHPESPIPMAANSRKTIRVNDFLKNTDFSTMVSGSYAVIAERAMYWDDGSGEAAHDSIGVRAGGMTNILPAGGVAGGGETYTLVANPNSVPVTVRVTYLTTLGTDNPSFTDVIPKQSRQTYTMSDTLTAGGGASIMVESLTTGPPKRPIICERAMYFNGKAGGHDSIGYIQEIVE